MTKENNQTVSASVRGGAPGATYYASVRYLNSDGPYDETATLLGENPLVLRTQLNQVPMTIVINLWQALR
ncbi:MAG: hypothetical protein CM1200mP10_14570 [Candidatus Neomarinimicrobiota bacterium]|nr:MAG: hypothetical protein CM1200mP10_14570 [Candidatus Neomarinimicrobiota bacterium]